MNGIEKPIAMRKALILPITLLALSGCVSQTTYLGSEKPVVENEIDNINAAKTRIALALQYLQSGNTTQAKFNLERASQFAPQLPEAHYSFAYYYQQVNEPQLAKAAYLKALALAPNDPNTLNNYGVFLCGQGEYADAAVQFHRAIAVPSYLRVAESYENLAMCALKEDNFELAEQHLRSAINHNGQRQSALINLATLLYAKSELHQAQGVIKNYEDKGFISPQSVFLKYLLETRMGHIEQAELQAKTLQQTYPASAQAGWLREDKVTESDVEQLRRQYRDAKLSSLLQQGDEHVVKQPQIKITRKVPERVVVNERRSEATAPQPSFMADSVPTQTIATPAVPTNSASNSTSNSNSPAASASVAEVQFYQPKDNGVVFNQAPAAAPEFSAASAQHTQRETVPIALAMQMPLLNEQLQVPKVPVHTVALGETLFSISVKYNLKMAKLLAWNAVKESQRLPIGSKIYLNNPQVVAEILNGDTLLSVANRYHLMVDDLMRWNKLTPGVALIAGRTLLIVDPNTYKL
ncbi:type IV pilus biogenesis/stability protein PilW [Pseudoalteromonas fenneropenaei]|uniref:Type IV pilus biogenesis/stability protein PilW n=1 Tax=Pseudoalteromonas fenneropenaei TaxID=1737459 RepID=A0ABV7CNH4_9GAMM